MSRDERLEQICNELGHSATRYAERSGCAPAVMGAYVYLVAQEDYEMASRLLARAQELVQAVEIDASDLDS